MKRICILALSLTLLAGCGTAAPEQEITQATTTEATTTTQTTTIAEPKNPDAKPFTKDDITAIENNFKTVADYVKAAPAKWYDVEYWYHVGGGIQIDFYDMKPEDDQAEPYLSIFTRDDVPGITDVEDVVAFTEQKLPDALLAAGNVVIHRVNFAKIGSAIKPPRGIAVLDSADRLFEVYPDVHTDEDILYDITAIYPWAKPEWGQWDGEGSPEYGGPMGGRIVKTDGPPTALHNLYIAQLIYADPPMDWDNRENDYPWVNMYDYRWVLNYYIEENIIHDIEFVLLYHPN